MREMTLGHKVKEARIAKQMTQKELAGDFITRNMLSQIENDNAAPSIKTIEYIASILDKPISYFMDSEQSDQGSIIEELLTIYEDHNYNECIIKIEKTFAIESEYHNHDLIKDIYINCCIKAGIIYKDMGNYENAQTVLKKVLVFEKNMIFDSNVILYTVYNLLAEINGYLKDSELSKEYNHKATTIINKMLASRTVQSISISLVEGNYDDAISRINSLDIEELDPYNKGRYYIILGSAHYYKKAYLTAIPYLEKAIPFYNDMPNNGVLITIYEQLSKSYSHIEEYKKAYQFLELTKLNN
ncbi:MAG: hypothetical protein CVV02_07130 [Firmicutes bacterium HGW-Firmicutes-7]|nr:MAG: hypothetical protein CVV02_07130 [Firmicutes bacterium HGW-Firmicutes-7]